MEVSENAGFDPGGNKGAISVSQVVYILYSFTGTFYPTAGAPTLPEAASARVGEVCNSPVAATTPCLWENPCLSSPIIESAEATPSEMSISLCQMPDMAEDAVAMLKEGADLAESLKAKILEVHLLNAAALASALDSQTFIQQDSSSVTNNTDVTRPLRDQHKNVSLTFVYLEQSRHDEAQCSNASGVLKAYDDLSIKLLRALCKSREILIATRSSVPLVPRSVMSGEKRSLQGDFSCGGSNDMEGKRKCRDYIVANNVRAILSKAAGALEEILSGCD